MKLFILSLIGALCWTIATMVLAFASVLIIFTSNLLTFKPSIDFEKLVESGDLIYLSIALFGSVYIDFLVDIVAEKWHKMCHTSIIVLYAVFAFFALPANILIIGLLRNIEPIDSKIVTVIREQPNTANMPILQKVEIILVAVSVLFALIAKTYTYYRRKTILI